MAKEKLKAVIIDDDGDWLAYLRDIISKHFDSQLETFESFEKAEKRLLEEEIDFDLMVTDILPEEGSRRTTGFEFARLVINQGIPVIVVTIISDFIVTAFREIKVYDAFDKGEFQGVTFINAIKTILKNRRDRGAIPPAPPGPSDRFI
jgi:response regulator RpfG family c-di-GMP phosphodiesterase